VPGGFFLFSFFFGGGLGFGWGEEGIIVSIFDFPILFFGVFISPNNPWNNFNFIYLFIFPSFVW